MKSYFFVPGTKINKVSTLFQNVDEIIIDLEDAVKTSERESIISSFKDFPEIKDCWVRVPVRESYEQKINLDFLKRLINDGFTKIILPKLKSVEELRETVLTCATHQNVQLILLIEHPLLLLKLEEVILDGNERIIGIALGSHDLMSILGGKHILKNLEYPRQQLLYLAKAGGIEAIDVASMELKNTEVFQEELKDGFEKGFDGKFLIHPWQLNLFNNFDFFSHEDTLWAMQVLEAFDKVGDKAEFSPVVINGEIIERPHINRAKMILKKNKHGK